MQKQISNFKEKLSSEITSVPEILKSAHLPGLDGLRGISIILVILSHIFRFTNIGKLFLGEVGVHIFFVISGFLITTILLKEKVANGEVSLRKFYFRRILRIFPVAYLFIIAVIILNHLFNLDIKAKSIFAAILYLKNVPSKNITDWYTGHFWTLSIEEQFYLIAPILLVSNTNKYLRASLIFILLIIFLELIVFIGGMTFSANTIIYKAIFGIINIFGKGTVSILIGSLSSIIIFKKIIVVENIKVGYYFNLVVFCLAILFFTFSPDFLLNTFSPVIFSMVISFIIVLNLCEKNFMTIILDCKFLKTVGVLSYSLYIWQELFTYNQPWKDSFRYSDSILLNMLALIIVSCLSYYLYEKQFLKLKERFLPKGNFI